MQYCTNRVPLLACPAVNNRGPPNDSDVLVTDEHRFELPPESQSTDVPRGTSQQWHAQCAVLSRVWFSEFNIQR
jgi:hypothetical protein